MPRLNRSRNRNGALFIGFLVIATLVVVVITSRAAPATNTNVNAVLADVGGGEIDLNSEVTAPANTNADAPGTTTYVNTEVGVTVHGVAQAEEKLSGDIVTIDFGGKDSLSILSPDLEGIVRESIGGTTETTITLDGVAGMSVTGASAKDGSQRTLVLVQNNNKLYVFDGSAEFLAALPNTVEFGK